MSFVALQLLYGINYIFDLTKKIFISTLPLFLYSSLKFYNSYLANCTNCEKLVFFSPTTIHTPRFFVLLSWYGTNCWRKAPLPTQRGRHIFSKEGPNPTTHFDDCREMAKGLAYSIETQVETYCKWNFFKLEPSLSWPLPKCASIVER